MINFEQLRKTAAMRRELFNIVQDLEQFFLFNVDRPVADIEAKQARARELHNELRKMQGKEPLGKRGAE